MKEFVKIFKALGDAGRLRIVKMLEVKPLCVCEITHILELAPSTVSKHLHILQEAGLIYDEKEGKWVNYSLSRKWDDPAVREVLDMLRRFLRSDSVIDDDKRKAEKADRAAICDTKNS